MRSPLLGFFAASLVAGAPAMASADPGELTAVELGESGNNFGYWEYLPAAYDESSDWPLLIFLSGIGENGDGTVPNNAQENGGCSLDFSDPDDPPSGATGDLCGNLRWGPQRLLVYELNGGPDRWDDVAHPFVVISPQNPAPLFQEVPYNASNLDTFVDYLLANYALDERRLYLTGMSIGGYSVLLEIRNFADRFSAVAVMPAFAGADDIDNVCNLTRQNIWAFHGEDDQSFFFPPGPVVNFVNAFDACPPPHPDARITLYEGAGHNVWQRTIYPPDGMADTTLTMFDPGGGNVTLDPYDENLYGWLLRHDKPDVDAGPDVVEDDDAANVMITATTIDDDAITYAWTQTAGGGGLTLAGDNTDTLTITNLAPGVYTFEVLAVDADGQWDVDDVIVTINDAGGGTNTTGTTGTTGSTGDGSTGSTGDASTGTESTGDTTGDDTGAATSAGTSTTDGGTSTASTTSASGSASASTTAATATATATDGSDSDSDSQTGGETSSDGCGCRTTDERPALLVLLLGLLGLGRRRRRRA